MKKRILFIVMGFIFLLICILIFWLFDSGSWGYGIIFSIPLIIFLLIFYFLRNQHFISKSNSILDICPNCKNPNTQNLKICEWCGGQII